MFLTPFLAHTSRMPATRHRSTPPAALRWRAQAQALLALALLPLALVTLAGCGSAAENSATDKGPASTALVPIGAGLRGPAGLKATVYAKGPATVAALAFDPQGRLWLGAAGLKAQARGDGVYMIARPGGPAVKVISGLEDPLGLAWFKGRLYVASTGRVDAFEGFDGRRFTAPAKVLNGPVAGAENNNLVVAPSGRLVMGVTATCDHCTPKSQWSGAIVSFLPDGSDLRLLLGAGRRRLRGSATAGRGARQARGRGQRGDRQRSARRRRGHLGLVAEWQSAKVLRVALSPSGSTYNGSVTPFLRGLRNPLALTLAPAPDRSLLVADWGTGTIYRVQG
jgi:glucose/arabinose dehydrogenase